MDTHPAPPLAERVASANREILTWLAKFWADRASHPNEDPEVIRMDAICALGFVQAALSDRYDAEGQPRKDWHPGDESAALAVITGWRARYETADDRIMRLLAELTTAHLETVRLREALVQVTAGPAFVEEMGSGDR